MVKLQDLSMKNDSAPRIVQLPSMAIIAAVAENRVIGIGNSMPWNIPEDLGYFKSLTVGNIVLMGRKTYESIGRPLPERINIVFSKREMFKQVYNVSSIEELSQLIAEKKDCWQSKKIFNIGGSSLFQYFLPYTDTIYLTRIYRDFSGDTYFPEINFDDWKIISRQPGDCQAQNSFSYEFIVYKRK